MPTSLGVRWINAPIEDALHAAGCDDATIVMRDGVMHLEE
jgi:hypothetical protein